MDVVVQTGPRGKTRLLIVDDEPSTTETLSIIFRRLGYEVFPALTGGQALLHLATAQPQLAILDVALPDMSGIDIAIQIQREYPNCKFVLFSGDISTSRAIDEAHENGHDFPVLAKPVPPHELIAAVRALEISFPKSEPT